MKPSPALTRRAFAASALAGGALAAFPTLVRAQTRTFSFGYDEPRDTGYGAFADRFAERLSELSGGALKVQQFPGGQLGSEPELAQKVRTGDLDFTINSAGNAAALSPQAGVLSLEYLFTGEPQLIKAVLDPGINDTIRKMIAATVTGANALGLISLGGLRNMYAKFPIASVADVKGKKVRVQATKTEDTFITAYGAVPVHMGSDQVTAGLQSGAIDVAENSADVYLSNKRYEVAPVLSLTQHEASTNYVFVSSKTIASLERNQQRWLLQAFEYAQRLEVPRAIALDQSALEKIKAAGAQVVANVNKASFADIAHPLVDQQGQALGPFSQLVIKQIRALAKT